ncbi:hypothetical protein ABG067_006946 [Albugo candida]
MELNEKPEAPPPLPHAHPLFSLKKAKEKAIHSDAKRLHIDFLNKHRVDALEAQSLATQEGEAGTLHSTKALWNTIKQLEDAPILRVALEQHEKELAATKAVDWPEAMPSKFQDEDSILMENEITLLKPRKVGKQVNAKFLKTKQDPAYLPRHPLMMEEEQSLREKAFLTTFEDIVSTRYGCVKIDSIKKRLGKIELLKEARSFKSETQYFPPCQLGQPAALNARSSECG